MIGNEPTEREQLSAHDSLLNVNVVQALRVR
jgi:hypothetical protein